MVVSSTIKSYCCFATFTSMSIDILLILLRILKLPVDLPRQMIESEGVLHNADAALVWGASSSLISRFLMMDAWTLGRNCTYDNPKKSLRKPVGSGFVQLPRPQVRFLALLSVRPQCVDLTLSHRHWW